MDTRVLGVVGAVLVGSLMVTTMFVHLNGAVVTLWALATIPMGYLATWAMKRGKRALIDRKVKKALARVG